VCFFVGKGLIFRRVRKIAEGELLDSSCLSVYPSAWNNWAPTGRIFMKFDIQVFFRKSVAKIQFSLKPDNINRYLT